MYPRHETIRTGPETPAANVETTPLKLYNRKTTFRVKFVDKAANWIITVGGLGVIVAVIGLIAFITGQVIPLFASADFGQANEPVALAPGRTMLLHTDEYRRVGVRITDDGLITGFAVKTGEVLRSERVPQIGDAKLTSVYMTLRPRTKRKIESTLDVPHFHLLLGTSDGRVLVGELTYFTQFEVHELGNEPEHLRTLRKPEEKEFKEPEYSPDVVVRNGSVTEHVATFGLYRSIRPVWTITREMDAPTRGEPVVHVAGQLELGSETSSRSALTVIVTGKGRTLLVTESLEVNAMTEEMEASSESIELTGELTGVPAHILVNELRDSVVLITEEGFLHHYQNDPDARRMVLAYPAQNVFDAQADRDRGWSWRESINDQRESEGFAPMPGRLAVTAVDYLLGDDTILIGDSAGGIQSWLTLLEEDPAAGRVWRRYARVRNLPPSPGAILDITASPITKSALITDDTGNVRAINNTAERVYLDVQQEGVNRAVFNRKGDGFLAVNDAGKLFHYWVDAPHSEVSLKSLFGSVWYESYPEPKYEWQSTGGTDDVEPKLSLMPLIMGTLKGALYALLFAVPLAVLAAIYTSEFMHRNLRSILKPTMEIMASLPSVVLGFLAALYFAPKAAPIMPTVICAFFIVPGLFLVFGWVWQRCPPSFVGRFGPWRSTALLFGLLGLGLWISSMAGPRAEVFLFPAVEGANPALLDPVTFKPLTESSADTLAAGDFRTWTGGGQELKRDTEVAGRQLPKGWWIPGGHNLFVVLVALPLILLMGLGLRVAGRRYRAAHGATPLDGLREKLEGGNRNSMRAVGADVALTLLIGTALTAVGLGVALLLAPVLESVLFSYPHPTAGSVADFRRWITGPDGWRFEQSNSLVVGFAMGFAVIPLIYTISEDALTSVPNQLRAASLACGASRWQTTLRVVLPAAASGIFSGIVIGLGRALGETMIVVMAAGGTPVMEMQPLNGFRSLSAAIAIEMPEAPHGGSLYRTLFLGGLVLFAMAFVMNTIAELVRMRLRKRLSRM